MNRELARFIGDVFDIVADNILLFGIVGVVCFLFGPSLLVLLERKERLPRVIVWVYTFVLTPIITLVLVFVANPQGYCNDPLPHEAFRLFYPLILPLLPLYIHFFRAKQLNHPVLFGLILVMLSLGVFSITVGNEIFHLAYQSVQGTASCIAEREPGNAPTSTAYPNARRAARSVRARSFSWWFRSSF